MRACVCVYIYTHRAICNVIPWFLKFCAGVEIKYQLAVIIKPPVGAGRVCTLQVKVGGPRETSPPGWLGAPRAEQAEPAPAGGCVLSAPGGRRRRRGGDGGVAAGAQRLILIIAYK